MKKRISIRPFSIAGFAVGILGGVAAIELMRGLAWMLWTIM